MHAVSIVEEPNLCISIVCKIVDGGTPFISLTVVEGPIHILNSMHTYFIKSIIFIRYLISVCPLDYFDCHFTLISISEYKEYI
jgi:hypothetical protein